MPQIVAASVARWGLELGVPFTSGDVAWTAPCRLADGRDAVLKVNFPEPDSEFEADALRVWGGNGAVRLIDEDRTDRALLLDRCRPGTSLWEVDEQRWLVVIAGVLRGLWSARPPLSLASDTAAPTNTGRSVGDATPFPTLAAAAERWVDVLPARWEQAGRPCARGLIDEAASLCAELGPTQPELVLCHQDAHGRNVLDDGDGWRAIDPKPILGEPAFDLASVIRDRRPRTLAAPDARTIIARRFDQLTSELGLDRARVRGWGIVHALVWGLGDEEMVACAEHIAAVSH